MISHNTMVVLAGAGLLGASAGAVGTFAVLRRRALTGDALAHAALPGLCLAFLLFGRRSLPLLLLGALATGLAGITIISLLRRWTRVKEDSAIGIVLSVFFGAGIVLSRLIQNNTTTGSQAGLDSYILGKTAGMIEQDVYLIGSAAAICVLLVVLLYKEFRLVVFDADFARVQGWPALGLDWLLMAMIALAVVIGLPAVGVVLMAALLILPGVAARFWSDRLGVVLVLSSAFGLGVALVGTMLSASFSKLPAGPIIVLVGTGLFLVSLFFAPKRGIAARVVAQRRFARQWNERNLLAALYELSEPEKGGVRAISREQIAARKHWSPGTLARLLAWARKSGYLVGGPGTSGDDFYVLSPAGLRRAAEVVRGQRLWQAFLTAHADWATGVVDIERESVEELLPAPVVDALRADLQARGRWPIQYEERVREVIV